MSSSAALPLEETVAPGPVQPDERTSPSPARGPVKRFFLRFGFVYLLFQMVPFSASLLPFVQPAMRPYEALWESVSILVGRRVFGITVDLVQNGSGDKAYFYVWAFCHLVLAVLLGLVWTIFDRKRSRDPQIAEWFRVYLRLSLALAMIYYGAIKLIPTQFGGTIGLERLVQPFGSASPMGLLWTFLAASPPYTAFTGAAEMLGGVLLIPRRTTLLGALVSAAVTLQVVVLNFCYDVPVKLFSVHLFVMALLLAAPDLRRLAGLFLFNRRVEPAEIRPVFARRKLNRVAAAVWGIGLTAFIVFSLDRAYEATRRYGILAPKSPLYGIWEVEELALEGRVRPPLLTDAERWRYLIFEHPRSLVLRTMNDESRGEYYGVELDTAKRTMTLSSDEPPKKSTLSYRRPEPDVLTLDGTFEGRRLQARLRRIDESELLLVSRGFHWINETPFNR